MPDRLRLWGFKGMREAAADNPSVFRIAIQIRDVWDILSPSYDSPSETFLQDRKYNTPGGNNSQK
jgi:hypothetical protein